jgi:hypothetical protein
MVSAPMISYRLASDAATSVKSETQLITSAYESDNETEPSRHTSSTCSDTKVTGLLP